MLTLRPQSAANSSAPRNSSAPPVPTTTKVATTLTSTATAAAAAAATGSAATAATTRAAFASSSQPNAKPHAHSLHHNARAHPIAMHAAGPDRPISHSHSDPAFALGGKPPALRASLSALSLSSVLPKPLSHHALRTAGWILLAGVVAVVIAAARSRQAALEFVTGYLVEYSLSVDNLFVFLLIFKYFRVPREAQESVLKYGIMGAMVLRGVMIVAGKALVHRFEWVALVFAALLIYSAGKLLLDDDDDDADLDENRVIRFSKALFPVADRYMGDRFFVRENGRLLATPLMVVLVSIELSDVVFALDSVPAVLGISNDTVVVYASNIFAIMGLRSLFFVLSTSLGSLRFLNKALAFVLGFIGVKMIAGCFGYDFGIVLSLVVVALALSAGVGLSIVWPAAPSARGPNSDVNSSMVGANSV